MAQENQNKKIFAMDSSHVFGIAFHDPEIINEVGKKYLRNLVDLDSMIDMMPEQKVDFKEVFFTSTYGISSLKDFFKLCEKAYDFELDYVISVDPTKQSPIRISIFEKNTEKKLLSYYLAPKVRADRAEIRTGASENLNTDQANKKA
jgi:hypothetical protein